jgi:hypothetical protein
MIYESSRGPIPVSEMSIPHALRAATKLAREHGEKALRTPLGQALARRALLTGSAATDVETKRQHRLMLRDPITGRWSGAWTDHSRRKLPVPPSGPADDHH